MKKNGTFILLYLNFNTYKFQWNSEKKEPGNKCNLEIWSIRSLDKGKDNQMVFNEYNVEFLGLIQTKTEKNVSWHRKNLHILK